MISYNTVNTAMPCIDGEAVGRWVREVAAGYGKKVGDINFIFVDDEEILRINREFVHHDYYTDHIGFDYSEGDCIAGDIFIGVDTVRSNAALVGATYGQELHRVIIHGVLHLCGIDDKESWQREEMQAAEDKALKMLGQTNAE